MKNKFLVRNHTNEDTQFPDIGKFPGGEIRVKLNNLTFLESVSITAYIFNSDDVMTLVMLTDALRRAGAERIVLVMPYIPYARQDRVCNLGEAFSIKAFASIINSLKFNCVFVYDAHSDVSTALLDNCTNIPRAELMLANPTITRWLRSNNLNEHPLYLVSPDAGAVKKSYDIAKAFKQFKGIIFADKVRETSTGKILKTVVRDLPEDIADAKLLIADDIIDGGRTFTELGKVLRPYCNELNLYATHGIFSAGKEVFEPFFDNVWVEVDFTEFQ